LSLRDLLFPAISRWNG